MSLVCRSQALAEQATTGKRHTANIVRQLQAAQNWQRIHDAKSTNEPRKCVAKCGGLPLRETPRFSSQLFYESLPRAGLRSRRHAADTSSRRQFADRPALNWALILELALWLIAVDNML